MDDMSAFERQVAAELVRRAGPVRPVDATAIFAAIQPATRSPQWRLKTMFSATKLVLAGAIVALFAGFLVSGVLPPSPEHAAAPGAIGTAEATPTASPSPTPSPDAVVPNFVATASLKVSPGPDAGPDELSAAEDALLRYAAMAQSRAVAEAVITKIGLDDSPERLLERISVETSDETLVLSLRVSDDDPEVARRIATALGDEVRQRVEDEVVTDEARAADRAIAQNRRLIGNLSERYQKLQRKQDKTPLDRQELVTLAGQIAALQRDVQQLTPSSSAFVRNRLEWLERPSISGQEEPRERPPQAEPSVAAAPEPTAEVEAVTTTRSDLVPGVDLVTEEVEPGVYRVASDGVRDLRRPVEDADLDPMSAAGPFDRSLHAAPDGSIWVFDPDGAFRLGQTDVIDVEWRGAAPVIDDSPDGSMWASWGRPTVLGGSEAIGLLGRLRDGAWQGRELARDWWSLPLADIAVGPDGTLWTALWSGGCAEDASTEDGPCGTYVAPLVDPLAQSSDELDGVLAPRLSKDHDYQGVVGLWATEDGSVWLLDAWENRQNREITGALSRFDGTSFERHDVPDWRFVRADMAADGTTWAILRNWKVPTLGRFDGSGWTVFDQDDGVPSMDDLYYNEDWGFFEVAPDGSVWLNPTEGIRRAHGVARFDGDSLQRYLEDLRVYAMDVAPDGTVWLEAGSYSVSKGKDHLGPIDMYVITPEAIAATE